MLINSWKSNLHAYGMEILDTLADDWQVWHQEE